MVRASWFLAAGVLLLSAPLLGAWTDDWRSIRKAAGNVRTLQADFVQTKKLKILKRPITSHGRFYYRRPKQIRWEYTRPVKSVVIMDADGVRRYTRRGNKYIRDVSAKLKPVQVVLSEMSLWMRGDFSQSKAFSPTLERGPPVRVRLVPRDEALRKFVSRIDLVLSSSPGVVDGIEISEGPDASTYVQFTNVKLNQPIADKVFKTVR